MTPPTSDAHVNQALIQRLEELHEKAINGDKNAEASLRAIGARATEGDEKATIAMNTLAVLHHQHMNEREWNEAGAAYERIMKKEPEAIAWARSLQESARSGDPGSNRLLMLLNAHKDKSEASAWAVPDPAELEGNVRVRNLPTMMVGASPFPHFHPESLPDRRSHDRRSSTLNAEDHTMNTTRPTLEEEYRMSVGALDPSTPVQAVQAKNLRKFLPMSPAIEAQLITMMLRGAAAGATQAQVTDPSQATPGPAAQPGIRMSRSVADHSTVAQRSVMMPPVCIRARDAIARNSPSAPALVDACNAAAGRQVFAPMAPIVVPQGAEGTVAPVALGRSYGNFRPIRSLGRIGTSHLSAETMGTQGICDQAASAKARNSPVYPQLAAACASKRRSNVLAGIFVPDGMSADDPAFRVALTDRGETMVQKNPKMVQFRATLPAGDAQRGFTMAMGVRDASSKVDPGFLAFVRPGLAVSPTLLQAFDSAMAM